MENQNDISVTCHTPLVFLVCAPCRNFAVGMQKDFKKRRDAIKHKQIAKGVAAWLS